MRTIWSDTLHTRQRQEAVTDADGFTPSCLWFLTIFGTFLSTFRRSVDLSYGPTSLFFAISFFYFLNNIHCFWLTYFYVW